MADDFEAGIERSYQELNPHLADQAERKRLGEKRKGATQLANEARDADWLLSQPQFCRWLLTQTDRAGIFDPSFHAHEGSTQYLAGFRAFALAMLQDLEARDPGLWVRISLERSKLLEKQREKEQAHDHRNRDDDGYDG